MDTEISQGNLGEVGKYDVAFKEGKLVVSANASYQAVTGTMSVAVDAKTILEAIKVAVPGKVDDLFITMFENYLGLK